MIDNAVLVSGGIDDSGSITDDTLLINIITGLTEKVGDLNVAREGHKMVTLNEVVYVLGGDTATDWPTEIEQWQPLSKTWTMSKYSLNVARRYFATLNVPGTTSELCG